VQADKFQAKKDPALGIAWGAEGPGKRLLWRAKFFLLALPLDQSSTPA
jgi:hypothetical protein